jgi:glycine cleavage system H protein
VNEAPEGGGWFMKIKVADKSELDSLLDQVAYQEFLKTL